MSILYSGQVMTDHSFTEDGMIIKSGESGMKFEYE